MRYIGCKINLLPEIKGFVAAHCGGGNAVFCDLFAGTGAVSRFFKPDYQIIANDLLYFSYVLAAATLENQEIPSFETLNKHGVADPFVYLETTKIPAKTATFITETYSPAGKNGRMYLTEENARRIDFIRSRIEEWHSEKRLTRGEYNYLLAALIEGIPFVSNITGTYGAYLKHWDKRAFKKFEMQRLPVVGNGKINKCFNENANELIRHIEGDILYLDPPYNTRQYLPNYHLLETVARYDNPTVNGVTGMRKYLHGKSDFCLSTKVEESFSTLVKEARFRHIVLSYSDDGLLSAEQISQILKTHCKAESVVLHKIPYNRYKGKIEQTKSEHNEFLFYAEKTCLAPCRPIQSSVNLTSNIPAARDFIKSPMNYIGGKHRLLPQIFNLFPTQIGTFLEPFAGGFNVSVNMTANKMRCNDMNYKVVELVRLFRYADANFVLNRIEEKIREYKLSPQNEKGYNAFRDYYNATGDPVDLFTLSCFSFNYQFRFNSKLEYNNPFGRNRSSFSQSTKTKLIAFMKALREKNLEFYTRDFRELPTDDLGGNDFIYCDPPYLITLGSYNDGKRGFRNWSETEEKDLLAYLDNANKQNIRFALSNVITHNNRTNEFLAIWSRNYKVHFIKSNYSNCSYNKKMRETKTQEVLITNY
ncbi:MAG: Dam family site-specific DNA-(adenine-N6)-methyltransferase [Puniceicoccales bacterium]|jgi:adenine-specific DNA-methyltransferase|nr:Dam family site-specific DNA-(adenine-N6)-methyltransferase [Puniceicoccales bacterium]